MIMYELNNELKSHLQFGQIVVDSYQVDNKGKLAITLRDDAIPADKPRYIRVIFPKFNMTEETFEIAGQKVEALYIEKFVKYFTSQYFVGSAITIVNTQDANQKITITGA